MNVIVTAPTIIGGVFYEASPRPQRVPDNIGQHLIDIGNAQAYQTKVVAPEVKKVEKKSSSASQPDPALPEPMPKKRRGRLRKSSS